MQSLTGAKVAEVFGAEEVASACTGRLLSSIAKAKWIEPLNGWGEDVAAPNVVRLLGFISS